MDAICQPVVACHCLPNFIEGVSKGVHPEWLPPSPAPGVNLGLMVRNSLTGAIEPFVPADGRRVRWYTCGPTVYDHSHMGHARAYLTFDILRRIVEDYFGYDMLYHCNITDVDDKIIARARQNKLIADFVAANGENWDVVAAYVAKAVAAKDASLAAKLVALEAAPVVAAPGVETREVEAWVAAVKSQKLKISQIGLTKRLVACVAEAKAAGAEAYISATLGPKVAALAPAADTTDAARMIDALSELMSVVEGDAKSAASDLRDVVAIVGAMLARSDADGAPLAAQSAPVTLIEAARSEVGAMLDSELGATVTDHAIYNAHAREFEKSWLDDMAALGVKEPDVLTRVTEYIPQIVDYVAKIVEKGLAYASPGGSVYLSIEAFKASGHSYRKLSPGGDTSAEDMAESEGALAGGAATEKRHANDFALWKASKPGEPFWPSPWGDGRPGWHIECSVVASDIVGPNMDFHAGGVDLKFPHHDNEMAQSEACVA